MFCAAGTSWCVGGWCWWWPPSPASASPAPSWSARCLATTCHTSHQPTNFVNLDHERVFHLVQLGLVAASLAIPCATFTYFYKYQQGLSLVFIYRVHMGYIESFWLYGIICNKGFHTWEMCLFCFWESKMFPKPCELKCLKMSQKYVICCKQCRFLKIFEFGPKCPPSHPKWSQARRQVFSSLKVIYWFSFIGKKPF